MELNGTRVYHLADERGQNFGGINVIHAAKIENSIIELPRRVQLSRKKDGGCRADEQ